MSRNFAALFAAALVVVAMYFIAGPGAGWAMEMYKTNDGIMVLLGMLTAVVACIVGGIVFVLFDRWK